MPHELLTSGRAGSFPGVPGGGYYKTAEVPPNTTGTFLLAVSTTLTGSGTPNSPSVTGLGLGWGVVVTAIDTEPGTPDMRLVLAVGSGTTKDVGGDRKVTIDFDGQEQFDVCWALTRHSTLSGQPVVLGATVVNDSSDGLMPITVPPGGSTYAAVGWTGANNMTPKSGYSLLATVDNNNQCLQVAYHDNDYTPEWTGSSGGNAVALAQVLEMSGVRVAVGGHLRQKQRSSEQDGLRATRGGRNSYQ